MFIVPVLIGTIVTTALFFFAVLISVCKAIREFQHEAALLRAEMSKLRAVRTPSFGERQELANGGLQDTWISAAGGPTRSRPGEPVQNGPGCFQ